MNNAATGLCVDRVHVWRGDRHVLKGVSLSLQPGELLHIRGANGTGKTTLLRVVCGLLPPEQGAVCWYGTPINEDREGYQTAMTYASHEPALKSDLTAIENLRFAVGLKCNASDAELRASLDQAGVGACADLPARVLSAGQRRRVAMARVVAVQATLWLLDEPFTNLDSHGSALMVKLLDQHLAAGGLALVAAHHELETSRNAQHLELAA